MREPAPQFVFSQLRVESLDEVIFGIGGSDGADVMRESDLRFQSGDVVVLDGIGQFRTVCGPGHEKGTVTIVWSDDVMGARSLDVATDRLARVLPDVSGTPAGWPFVTVSLSDWGKGRLP